MAKHVRVRATPDVATAEARITRILNSKGRDALEYLQGRGRERFLRELQEDGLTLSAAVEIVDRHEHRLSSEELDRVLADLKARLAGRAVPKG